MIFPLTVVNIQNITFLMNYDKLSTYPLAELTVVPKWASWQLRPRKRDKAVRVSYTVFGLDLM